MVALVAFFAEDYAVHFSLHVSFDFLFGCFIFYFQFLKQLETTTQHNTSQQQQHKLNHLIKVVGWGISLYF